MANSEATAPRVAGAGSLVASEAMPATGAMEATAALAAPVAAEPAVPPSASCTSAMRRLVWTRTRSRYPAPELLGELVDLTTPRQATRQPAKCTPPGTQI